MLVTVDSSSRRLKTYWLLPKPLLSIGKIHTLKKSRGSPACVLACSFITEQQEGGFADLSARLLTSGRLSALTTRRGETKRLKVRWVNAVSE